MLPHFENLLYTFAMQYKIKVQGNCELVCLLSSIRRKKKESHITPDAEMEDCLD